MAAPDIDRINIKYSRLFTVTLLHTGYGAGRNNSISEAVSILPDEATERLMNQYDMGYRFLNDTLICFIRTGLFAPPAFLPAISFVKFHEAKLFRFLMFASADFLAKTNVQAAGATTVYQFSNKVNVAMGGFISMHTAGTDDDDLKVLAAVKPAKNCFGVIDILSQGASAVSYELFDGAVNQQLKSPAYSILFKSKI